MAHLESCNGSVSVKGSEVEQHLSTLKGKQERTKNGEMREKFHQ